MRLTLAHSQVRYENQKPIRSIGSLDELTIDYDRYCELGPSAYSSENLKKHLGCLIFSKNLDWSNEREYRLVMIGAVSSPVAIPIGDSLIAIAIGDRVPTNSVDDLVRAFGNRWQDVAIMNWKNGYPQPYPVPPRTQ